MSEAETKLAAFWRQERPPARDASFRLAVLERQARRRFHRSMMWVILAGVSALVCFAMLAPKLSVLVGAPSVGESWRVMSAIATCALTLWAFMRSRQTF